MRENEHNIDVKPVASVFIWFNLDSLPPLRKYGTTGKVPVPYRTVRYRSKAQTADALVSVYLEQYVKRTTIEYSWLVTTS